MEGQNRLEKKSSEVAYTIPIPATVHDLQLTLHLGYIIHGPCGRVDAVLESSILSRKTKSVPSHRKDGFARVEYLESGKDIGNSIDS